MVATSTERKPSDTHIPVHLDASSKGGSVASRGSTTDQFSETGSVRTVDSMESLDTSMSSEGDRKRKSEHEVRLSWLLLFLPAPSCLKFSLPAALISFIQ